MEVVMRMLRMDSIQRDVLDGVERTLRSEFMSNLARATRRDAHEMMAEIFNNLDRAVEGRFLSLLDERNHDAAEKIKALMFTFDDLGRLNGIGVQVLLRNVDKEKLPLALKGASERIRDLFLKNLSERAGKMLREDIENLGPVKLRAVDEAQASIVLIAKEMAQRGEITLERRRRRRNGHTEMAAAFDVLDDMDDFTAVIIEPAPGTRGLFTRPDPRIDPRIERRRTPATSNDGQGILYAEDFDFPADMAAKKPRLPRSPNRSFSAADVEAAHAAGHRAGFAAAAADQDALRADLQVAALQSHRRCSGIAAARSRRHRPPNCAGAFRRRHGSALRGSAEAHPDTRRRRDHRHCWKPCLPGLRAEPVLRVRIHPDLEDLRAARMDRKLTLDEPAGRICNSPPTPRWRQATSASPGPTAAQAATPPTSGTPYAAPWPRSACPRMEELVHAQ